MPKQLKGNSDGTSNEWYRYLESLGSGALEAKLARRAASTWSSKHFLAYHSALAHSLPVTALTMRFHFVPTPDIKKGILCENKRYNRIWRKQAPSSSRYRVGWPYLLSLVDSRKPRAKWPAVGGALDVRSQSCRGLVILQLIIAFTKFYFLR